VLKNMEDLEHVDYARYIYSGERGADHTLTFKDRGCVFGPIRLSADPDSAVYRMLITPATAPEFIRAKI